MNSPQDAQNGRPARPQRAKRRIIPSYPPTLSLPGQALFPWPYGELLRFTTRGITRVTLVNAAEPVRRLCLARTPLADFFRILLEDVEHELYMHSLILQTVMRVRDIARHESPSPIHIQVRHRGDIEPESGSHARQRLRIAAHALGRP